MPQNYKKKEKLTEQQVFQLMFGKELQIQGTSIRKAAAGFNIDKMTLSRYIAKCKTQPQPSFGYAAVTLAKYIKPANMESDLARHIITLADIFHVVFLEKCKELAYEFGIRNKLKLPFHGLKIKK